MNKTDIENLKIMDDGKTSIRFDSVKGNTQNCDVYMVYSNKKAYPSYLISYRD